MQSHASADLPAITGLTNGRPNPATASALDHKWKAALDFESMFLGQLMKGMRQTVSQDETTGPSSERQTFTEMLDQQYASLSARSKANLDPQAPERARSGTTHSLAAQVYRSMLRHDATTSTSIQPRPEIHNSPPVNDKPAKTKPLDEKTLTELANDAARRHGLPASLIRGVIQAESGGDSTAVSRAGAKGLMQLMDGTASDLGVTNSFDPVANVNGGARYLKELMIRFKGDITKALAGYNAGPGAVEKHAGVPPFPETKAYVKSVLNQMRHFEMRLGE
jgi:soluble lytic murein transglycosylase-like protein